MDSQEWALIAQGAANIVLPNEFNFIIENGNNEADDAKLFNLMNGASVPFSIVSADTDIFDLLVRIEAFPSKGQARKNWNGVKVIPPGFSIIKVGKNRNMKWLFIWNPQARIQE